MVLYNTQETQRDLTAIAKIESNKYWYTMGLLGKVTLGNATGEEIDEAGEKTAEMLATARFFAFMSFPGAIFMLPAMIEYSRHNNIDFIPDTIAVEF